MLLDSTLGTRAKHQLQHHTKTMVESEVDICGKSGRDVELSGMVHPALHIALKRDKRNSGSILLKKKVIHAERLK